MITIAFNDFSVVNSTDFNKLYGPVTFITVFITIILLLTKKEIITQYGDHGCQGGRLARGALGTHGRYEECPKESKPGTLPFNRMISNTKEQNHLKMIR